MVAFTASATLLDFVYSKNCVRIASLIMEGQNSKKERTKYTSRTDVPKSILTEEPNADGRVVTIGVA